jgi:hypothetical protein
MGSGVATTRQSKMIMMTRMDGSPTATMEATEPVYSGWTAVVYG